MIEFTIRGFDPGQEDLMNEICEAMTEVAQSVFLAVTGETPTLGIADTHGAGLLTGTAATAIEAAGLSLSDGTGQEFEEYATLSAAFSILAVIHKRRTDGEAIQADAVDRMFQAQGSFAE